MANMPNSTNAFEANYYDDFESYLDFYNEVYDHRNDAPLYPYRYGAFQVYKADRDEQ